MQQYIVLIAYHIADNAPSTQPRPNLPTYPHACRFNSQKPLRDDCVRRTEPVREGHRENDGPFHRPRGGTGGRLRLNLCLTAEQYSLPYSQYDTAAPGTEAATSSSSVRHFVSLERGASVSFSFFITRSDHCVAHKKAGVDRID